MAFAWIFSAFVLGIIPPVQGINESSSLTSYKPTIAEPMLQTSIKPHISVISTINTGSQTHHVKDNNASNTIADFSVVRTVQASYSSNQGSRWVTMATPQRETTPCIQSSSSVPIDFKDTTNMNQKTEISSWSLTSYPSLNTNLNTFKASEKVYIGTSENSIAHVIHTTFSSKKESSVKQLSFPPFSTQSYGPTYKTDLPNPSSTVSFSSVIPESSKNKTIESVSEPQLVSTVPILGTVSEHSREVWISINGSSSVPRLMEASGFSMAVLFSTKYKVAATTSTAHQNSLRVDNSSKLLSKREDNATTANYTVMTFITRTTAKTTITTVEASLHSSPAVVMDTSLLHSKTESITKGSASGYQERQTGNISRPATPTTILGGTVVGFMLVSLTSMKSHSTRLVTSQSTSRSLIASVSWQGEADSSGSHFTAIMAETTVTPGGLSKTETARNNFTNIISLQRTVARVSLTETTLASFQTKGIKGSLFVTPVPSSTIKLSVQENGLFSGTSTTKTSSIFKGLSSVSSFQGELFPTSTETVVFPMTPTTTPKAELNTSYVISDVSKTIDLTQTLKLSNIFTRITSVPASLDSTFFPIVQNKTSSNSSDIFKTSGVFSNVNATRTSVNSVSRATSTVGSSLQLASLMHTITSSVTKTFLLSMIYKTTDVFSEVNATRTTSRDASTMGSSLPLASLMDTIASSVTKTSLLSMIYKTTDVLSEVSDTVSPYISTMSSLSIAQKKTSLKRITASSKTTDVSSDVHATETSVSVFPHSTIGSTLSMASSIQMTTSFLSFSSDVNDSRKSLSSYNASGNIVTSIYQTDKKVASFSTTRSKEFTIKESSWITDTVSDSSIEHSSNKLTISQYITPTRTSATFSSSFEVVRERINTSNIISGGSTLETRPVGTSRHTSNIKSIMFHIQSSVKSISDIPYPFTTSLTDKTTLSAKGSITTTPLMTVDRSSRLRSQTVTPVSSSLPFVVSSGDRETFVLTTQNPSQVVSVSMKDKTSTHDYFTTVHSPSMQSNLSSISGLPSTSNTKQEETSSVPTSKLTSLGDTYAWETSTVQHSYDNSRASSNEKLRRTSVNSTRHSSQVISTSMSKEIMQLSNTSRADYPTSLLSTTTLQSTHILASRYIHSTPGLTSQPSSTQSKPFGSSQGTSHTLATREMYSSKQSSQTISSDLPKTASTTQRLSATITIATLKLSSASEKRSKSTKSADMSTFTTYHTMKSLFVSQSASQTTVSGQIASTGFIVGLSSITKASKRQTRLVSSTDISKHRSSTSSPLASLKISTDPDVMTTLASSWVDGISEVKTVASLIFVTSSHPIKSTIQPYGSVNTNVLLGYSSWSLSSKTKGTLDNIQTQASITSHVVLPSTSRTSSIALDTTKTFRGATPAPVTSVSVSTQTALPPESPKQFDGRMILQMSWQPEYQYSYTQEYLALASKITRQLTKVLETIEGFLSVQVTRLWKSSVGVDFIVLVRKSAQVSENSVERTIIEANNTGALDLPLTSLQVQEIEYTSSLPTYHPTPEDKSIETWTIIIIVAGILVFLMLLIICILVVKLTKQSGGLRRSRKYELSSVSNYLYTDCTDSASKPVILRMEERRRDDRRVDPVAVSAYGVYGAYGMANSNSEESLSLNESIIPTNEHTNHNNSEYRNSSKDSITSNPVVSRMEERIYNPVSVNTYTTMNSYSEEYLSHNEGRMPPKTCTNNSNSEYSNSSKDSITSNTVTSQLKEPNHNCEEDPEAAETPCTINSSNGSNEATTSSSSISQTKENQQKSISTDENGSHQNQGYKDEEKSRKNTTIRDCIHVTIT